METQNSNVQVLCTCDFHPPQKWQLTSAAFLAQLARDHYTPYLSAPQIVYRAFEALLNHTEGTLYGFDGRPIDLFAEYKNGEDIFEWAFGGDWGRGMRRLLERADRPFRNQMKATPKLLTRILLLHYARQIQLCTASSCLPTIPSTVE